ncbi:MAG: lipoyl(octanoyl) transferase LipB [Pseudomonadota bacterium]
MAAPSSPLKASPAQLKSAKPVEWRVTEGFIPYSAAVEFMEDRVAQIRAGAARELVWLLEHEPLYTAGTSAKPSDLIAPDRFPVFKTSRGGQYTYHGPGQRVAYIMLDLDHRGRDIRAFVHALEDWIIETLAGFGLQGETRDGRVGVWIDRTEAGGPRQEDKIAAIGVRVRKWVSFHGISLNVSPDLAHFSGITPCGIDETGLGVTSLSDLGLPANMVDADLALRNAFEKVFGPTLDGGA